MICFSLCEGEGWCVGWWWCVCGWWWWWCVCVRVCGGGGVGGRGMPICVYVHECSVLCVCVSYVDKFLLTNQYVTQYNYFPSLYVSFVC